MKVSRLIPISSILLCTALLPSAGRAQNHNSRPAEPGTINYVEGRASLDTRELNSGSVGSTQLQNGQSLKTAAGKVEVLLVPGTFLRVDDDSSVRMVNAGLADTEVEITKGRAMVEATDISKNNDIRVDQNGVTTRILKNGLYDFDSRQSTIRVLKGKAEVLQNEGKSN
jgi:FecR-like protein